jgi:transcription initiation factor TFIID TATA-box-binding protein
MTETIIVNVVATADLEQKVDLSRLKFRDVLYDLRKYGGRVAYLKTSGMKGKVSIFSSGKMISVGTRSEKNAFHELEHARKFLFNKGIITQRKLQPKIQNLVVVVDFEENVNLETLSQDQKMIYEPEQFPGGILRVDEPFKATVLIFASGKAVVAGLKNSDQVGPTVQKLVKLLKA